MKNLEIQSTIKDAWEFTLRTSVEPPVYGDIIQNRFSRSTSGQPLTLFVPWGVSPTRTDVNAYDDTALRQVQQYSQFLSQYGVSNEVMIMPADLYATEINGDDPERVTRYFNAVYNLANGLNFSILPWSAIRDQNNELYNDLLRYECSTEALIRSTPKNLWYRSLLPASTTRNITRGYQAVAESAFRYLRERIAEARIIESVYAPVKLSMATPTKDAYVDRELPRLYILEDKLMFPWIKPQMI